MVPLPDASENDVVDAVLKHWVILVAPALDVPPGGHARQEPFDMYLPAAHEFGTQVE